MMPQPTILGGCFNAVKEEVLLASVRCHPRGVTLRYERLLEGNDQVVLAVEWTHASFLDMLRTVASYLSEDQCVQHFYDLWLEEHNS